MKKIVIVAVIVVLGLGGAGFWYWEVQAGPRISFRTEEVTRGRLIATVSATGTLQAQDVVDVGAQVQGRIIKIGEDKYTNSKNVDWGSDVKGPRLVTFTGTVTRDSSIISNISDMTGLAVGQTLTSKQSGFPGSAKIDTLTPASKSITMTESFTGDTTKLVEINTMIPGTLLALIDPTQYEAQRNAVKASVLSAKAQVKSAEADVLVKTATLSQATNDWGRTQKLFKPAPPGSDKPQADDSPIQKADYDQSKAVFEAAQANLDVSKAMREVAKAQVDVQEANLKNAQTNLDYCTITAPVTGKIVDRRVNMGQTVVASLSAPSLFLIAKDISKLEVWATVNEVNIGKIKPDQDVIYTVDANPGRGYKGKVVPQGKLPYRLNATMTSNVVTYTVVVSVDNKDEVLKPYMTTNLQFIVENKEKALLVPNAALRWQPTKEQIAPEQRDSYNKLKSKTRTATDADSQDQGFFWTQGPDGFVRYTQVKTGSGDGSRTEILSVIGEGELPSEHTQLIVGEGRAAVRTDGSNPFSVQPFKPKPKE